MDLIANLMNPNKPLDRILVPTGQVDGVMNVEADDDNEQCEVFQRVQSMDHSTSYADEYQEQEQQLYLGISKEVQDDPEQAEDQDGAMSVIDHASDLLSSIGRVDVDNLKQEHSRETYTKYNFNKNRTQQLMIDDFRERILSLVNTNNVVIIQGPTGCGKTTQVPQFILDDCRDNDRPCRIIVTQPRRIAAISVANRVCEERKWPPGTICGYQVGLETNLSGETLLAYVTTGILLQKLIRQKNLHEYTHIIVDEVHERNQDMDFLLLIIRRFINTNSFNTKIILMSATFDTEEFSQYFKTYSRDSFIPAPVIYVSKNNSHGFHTQTYFVEQLAGLGMIPRYDVAEPKIESCLLDLFVVLIRAFDRLDGYHPLTKKKTVGSVLVFLPGILEIEEAHDRLLKDSKKQKEDKTMHTEWHILPLHSSITNEEQKKVFRQAPDGERKIILSTNIAESSITVPDIFYVVDFCLTKTMVVDPDTQYQSLQLQWASHVNCTQRAGRVGRVSDGRVYRLITRDFYENYLSDSVQPEILRAPINQVVLKAKLLELNQPPKAILALAMNPPDLSKIENTVLFLKEIGGLSLKCNDQKSVTDGDITFLGRVMASLPLDVHLSKFILLGHMFSCLEDCVVMATGCSLNVFKSPFKARLKAYINRLQWADGSASDLIAHRNMYKVWLSKKRINFKVEGDWCKKNYVSQRSMREWFVLVKEVQDRLMKMHIRPSEGPGRTMLSSLELPTVVKVAICGAFYPYYFKRSSDGGQIDEREAVKTLGGRDPFNTVYFTGFDPQQPGALYANYIKNQLEDCGTHMHVGFDCSSKVYVQFTNPMQIESVKVDGQEYVSGMPGKIRADVYRAVRLRQLRIPVRVPVLEKEKAWEMAKEKGLRDLRELPAHFDASVKVEEPDTVQYPPVLPGLDVQFIKIYICERTDCGHFWAHHADEETSETLSNLEKKLNHKELKKARPEDIKCEDIYAAKYKQDQKFYRCKVVSKNPFGKTQTETAQIIFIDYGNTDSVGLDQLYELPDDVYMSRPGQAMECYLSEIQPSVVFNPQALWVPQANYAFDGQANRDVLYGKVYSVVEDIVHLELYNDNRKKPIFENSINHWLIEKGYAQSAEESFLSKENHQRRQQLIINPDKFNVFLKEESMFKRNAQDVEPPDYRLCNNEILLRGPFSPLEMQIFSVVASGANKHAVIEGNSVNAVLLDTHPEDPHERLVVAAHISQNVTGTSLSLRHTTVMPNIHGFPMLMSLLFCPTMETKPTEDGSRFGAVLCGLGAHDVGHRSIYPPHDICLTLDTDLSDNDLNKINMLRYWMNMAVYSMDSSYQQIPGNMDVETCQRELKDRLFELLKEERKSVERIFIKNASVWGKCLFYSELLKPGESYMTTEIWPLHSTMKLNRDAARQTSMNTHLEELREITTNMRKPASNEILCRFCNQTVYSTLEMRVHLTTNKHLEAVKAAGINANMTRRV